MRTRHSYLSNAESFTEKEEADLIKDCIEDIKEAPFYSEWNPDFDVLFTFLNMECVKLYEVRNKKKIRW